MHATCVPQVITHCTADQRNVPHVLLVEHKTNQVRQTVTIVRLGNMPAKVLPSNVTSAWTAGLPGPWMRIESNVWTKSMLLSSLNVLSKQHSVWETQLLPPLLILEHFLRIYQQHCLRITLTIAWIKWEPVAHLFSCIMDIVLVLQPRLTMLKCIVLQFRIPLHRYLSEIQQCHRCSLA